MLWSQERERSRLSVTFLCVKALDFSQASSVMKLQEAFSQRQWIHYWLWQLPLKVLYQYVHLFLLQNAPTTANLRNCVVPFSEAIQLELNNNTEWEYKMYQKIRLLSFYRCVLKYYRNRTLSCIARNQCDSIAIYLQCVVALLFVTWIYNIISVWILQCIIDHI